MNWLEETLAEQLHKEYRAAFKAMCRNSSSSWVYAKDPRFPGVPNHDHGWKACHRREYFLRRARRWIVAEHDQKLKETRMYWPEDLSSPLALCLRRDHMHTREQGCWIPVAKELRLKEAYPVVVMKDPAFESPEENT